MNGWVGIKVLAANIQRFFMNCLKTFRQTFLASLRDGNNYTTGCNTSSINNHAISCHKLYSKKPALSKRFLELICVSRYAVLSSDNRLLVETGRLQCSFYVSLSCCRLQCCIHIMR